MEKERAKAADDALFEALGKNKKRKKRKLILTVVSIVLVAAWAASAATLTADPTKKPKYQTCRGGVHPSCGTVIYYFLLPI